MELKHKKYLHKHIANGGMGDFLLAARVVFGTSKTKSSGDKSPKILTDSSLPTNLYPTHKGCVHDKVTHKYLWWLSLKQLLLMYKHRSSSVVACNFSVS